MTSSAISSLIEDSQYCFETRYLEGMRINEVVINRLADSFLSNNFASSLWWNWNPIKAGGAAILAI